MSQRISNPLRVCLTGAAGFIGSHLTEYLLTQGYIITGIDNFDPFYDRSIKESNLKNSVSNSNFCLVECDIRDKYFYKKLNHKSYDVVIHLAAKAGVLPSIKEPHEYVNTNILGTFNILEWMKNSKIKKLIFASSSSVYGNTDKMPFSEFNSADNPISPYAFTKKSCEIMNFTYHHLYKIDVLNLRLFTVYGERQRPDLAIYKFVNRMLNNEEITIYGNGTSSRDYTYIKDIIHGFDKALNFILTNRNQYEVINLGNNHPISVIELVNKIAYQLKSELKLKYEPIQSGDVLNTFADITKAKSLLCYEPKTALDEGIQNFIDWYTMNTNHRINKIV